MADDVQGLIVLTEGDRFVTIGRAGRAMVWRVDLSGEPVDDVDRTGAAAPLGPACSPQHHLVQHRDGRPPWCNLCRCLADGTLVDDLPPRPRQHRVSNRWVDDGYLLVCTCGWRTETPMSYEAAMTRASDHQQVKGEPGDVDE